MNIACLGWGSLIWDPQSLPIQHCWFSDGPLLPLEFARHSKGDRITLVMTPEVRDVRSLWTLFTAPDLETAKEALAEREGINAADISKYIGAASDTGSFPGPSTTSIGRWASVLGLDAVVWTNLPPEFQQELRAPSVEEVLSFLQSLSEEAQKNGQRNTSVKCPDKSIQPIGGSSKQNSTGRQ